METEALQRRFAAIGARVKIAGERHGSPQIDVRSDRRGEFFEVRFVGRGHAVDLEVVDVKRTERHLLLLARDDEGKSKFLCGHDERHWFVAAVPETARGVTGVQTAKTALQPNVVRDAIERVRPKNAFRRRNPAYVRQGEWFFVPAPRIDPPVTAVLFDEPVSRGRGKPHMMQFAYRQGGELVWVNYRYPNGITEAQYRELSGRAARFLGPDDARRRSVREGRDPAPRPRDRCPARLASRRDEHRAGRSCDAPRRVPRLIALHRPGRLSTGRPIGAQADSSAHIKTSLARWSTSR
ncbi:MAG: hypothetical protein ACXVUE_09275 [Solirubrobacteraceae bacterium]